MTTPDISVWAQAVDLYNKTLTKDPNKRIDVNTGWGPGIHSLSSVDQLIDFACETKKCAEEKKWKFSSRVDEILLWFNRNATVVDVMIQHQPHITALVWGGIRSLLAVAIREIEVSDKIGSSLLDLLKHIGRWETYLQLWPATPRLSAALVELLAQIINFLVRASTYHQTPPHKRYVKASFTFFNEKVENILASITRLADNAEKEALLASQVEQRKQFTRASADSKTQALISEGQMHMLRNINLKCESLAAMSRKSQNNQESALVALASCLRDAQVHEIQNRQQAAIRWIRQGLSATVNIPHWEKDTCEWITTHKAFLAWKADGYQTPLWIHGIPGCGKSVLASYLTHNGFNTTDTPGGVFAYFFQKSQDTSTPSAMVCSVVAEIMTSSTLNQSEGFFDAISSIEVLMDRHSKGTDCPLDMTWRILESLMAKSPGFAIIVDGIDECAEKEDVKKLLQHLGKMAQTTNARIIVCSRYFKHIHQSLGNITRLLIEADQIGADIQAFVRAEIDRTTRLAKIKERLLTKCNKQSHGMFLWARLMLDAVKAAPDVKTQLEIMESFPPGLDAVYAQFINKTGRGLDSAHLSIRRQFFTLIIGSFQFLTINDIGTAMSLDVRRLCKDENRELFDVETKLCDLCSPLVVTTDGTARLIHASVKDYLTGFENPTSLSISLDATTTNQFMVTRCLCMLMLPEFNSRSLIADLLRRSMYKYSEVEESAVAMESPSTLPSFYKYAALNWHSHLVALPQAPLHTLKLVAKFFKSPQLVTWAESLFLLRGGLHGAPAMEVGSYLKSWLTLQPPSSREIVPMKDYVESAYGQLLEDSQMTKGFPLASAFIRSRLAEYHAWTANITDSAFDLLVTAAKGLEDHLGPHQLTLMALDALATGKVLNNIFESLHRTASLILLLQGTLVRGLHEQAAQSHAEVRRQRIQILGPTHREVYMSMSYECLSNFHTLNFREAQRLGEEASRGLLATGVPTTRLFLHNQLYLGYALEGQHKIKEAQSLYENAYATWMDLNGPDDPSTLMTQSAMASTYRKLGKLTEAERHYIICFAGRQRAMSLDNYLCIDLAISLAYVYCELHRNEEAAALLEICLPLPTLKKPAHFERVCQIRHLQALMLYDEDPAAAEDLLHDLINASRHNRPPVNRELAWVRVTLANWLRNRGKLKEALLLFQDLVMPIYPSHSAPLTDEQCNIAEEGVRLVKAGLAIEARRLLGSHNLQWARDYYFDIIHGAPLTDTAWERGYL
ncbi:Tetratricopeptide-like helical [Penicillium griseofulvum]|uniref:Tetratricopeptide-like helical n=1 Tax=Penicillium patulum TaxID=5078 RepID=A0A135LGR8_PENPA|nr:Tetratricopeptide-like helical [Penicillium griseofulvum]KXG48154.1 Tetratricopeptide-like helical [Penicillium griseofulvum]